MDEEYDVEIAHLQVQVNQLTAVRDRILGLDEEAQVKWTAHSMHSFKILFKSLTFEKALLTTLAGSSSARR